MNLQKFGKLMKQQYGSIGGELLSNLFDFYIADQKEFEKRFSILEEKGSKGCFLYEDGQESFIVFGIKYVDVSTINIKGKIMAVGKDCPFKVGDYFVPMSDEGINSFKMLDSASLISIISEYDMITSENDITTN